MKRNCAHSVALFLLALSAVPDVYAQESLNAVPDPASALRAGTIAGHTFIPSSFMRDPFVRTYFQTGLGFGSTLNRVIPAVTVEGKPLAGPNGNLLFAVMDMEYQYAIRPWLAVRGRLDVTGRMADETSTLVAAGVTLYTGLTFDWLFKFAESERFQMSGSFGVKNAASTDVYLERFVEGIMQNGEILPGNNLVVTTPLLRGTAGLQGTYVISRLTGLTITGDLAYGESFDPNGADRWYYGISAAFDFNLRSNDGVPLGFLIGGKTGSAPDLEGIDSRTAQTLFGRIAYTGGNDFALGLDLAYNYIPVRNTTEKQNFLSAVVDIRLYF